MKRPPLKTDEEIAEARRIIAVQLSTRPANGNIGPTGSLERAAGVTVIGGGRAVERLKIKGYGLNPRYRDLNNPPSLQ